MEAIIEAWWNVGNFGLVYLLNQPGEFIIYKGQPIAQMFILNGASSTNDVEMIDGYPSEHFAWLAKRSRPDYRKDLDYFRGKKYDGEDVPTHLTNWKQAAKYRNG
jgi:hypothetical protein